MKTDKLVYAFFGFCVLCAMLLVSTVALADDDHARNNITVNSNNQRTVDRSQNTDVDVDITTGDTNVDANAAANANAEGGDGGDGGNSSVTIDSRRPGNSYIGGGDSTASEQKVFAIGGGWLTGNASFRFDLTDKDARKLRIASDWRKWGMSDFLVNKMQCSAKVVYKPFGSPEKCEEALAPPPPTGVMLTHDEYHDLTMAQVTQEEYTEQQELVEYRQVQQQHLIDALEDDAADDNREIEALKVKVDQAIKERDRREVVEEQKQASFAKIYSKYAEQVEEPADDQD